MESGNGNGGPSAYEADFESFIRMCGEAKASDAEVVLVAKPSVLGYKYAELIESLGDLAEDPPAKEDSGRACGVGGIGVVERVRAFRQRESCC
ncbi:hypothetical protein KJ567_05125 [Candidatus Bipolaricaulota bacterium]|nr:hypothetical protein [Candidatus Bipolaricaulota bacterium]